MPAKSPGFPSSAPCDSVTFAPLRYFLASPLARTMDVTAEVTTEVPRITARITMFYTVIQTSTWLPELPGPR